MRDAYVKERKYDVAKTYGMKIKMKRPWRLKKQMEFLTPFIHNRKDLYFDSTKENNEKNDKEKFSKELNNYGKNAIAITMVSSSSEGNSDPVINLRKNLFNQPVPESNNYRLIEIDSFFRNISDAVKTLNEKNQLMVQRDVTNVVMNYKLKELETNENAS